MSLLSLLPVLFCGFGAFGCLFVDYLLRRRNREVPSPLRQLTTLLGILFLGFWLFWNIVRNLM